MFFGLTLHTQHTGEDLHGNRRDYQNLRKLLPFLSAYKGRAILALLCLVLSKFATVSVPLVLKEIIDKFDGKEAQVLVLPIGFLLAYGAFRLLSSLFNELMVLFFASIL